MNKLLVLFLLTTNLFLVGTESLSTLPLIECSEYSMERVGVDNDDDPSISMRLPDLVFVAPSFVGVFAKVANKYSRYTSSYAIRAPPSA